MKTHSFSRLRRAMVASGAGLSALALSLPADARDIEDELQDEALIFPYYTVRDGWNTLTNVTNTSPYTIVAKVRYRESNNSRDVLDFNLILSPFDVWTGWVTEGPNGPRLYTRDASCTTPIFEEAGDGSRFADMSNLGYQQDGGPTSIDRAREGHFEVLVMAEFSPGAEDKKWSSGGNVSSGSTHCAPNPPENQNTCATNDTPNTISWSEGDPMYPTAYYAKHVDGKPRNCSIVDERFVATTPFNKPSGGDTDRDGDPLAEWDINLNHAYWPWVDPCDPATTCPERGRDAGDVLKGNFGLVNVGQGTAAGGIATAISMGCGYNTEDLVTAQQFPYFLEPTLYSAGCDTNNWSGFNGGNWSWNPDSSYRLAVAAANNEWSFNPNTGAETDWVVTFPTKEFHVDISETDIYAGVNPDRLHELCTESGGKWSCTIWGDPSGDKDTFEEAFLAAGGLIFADEEGSDDEFSFEETFGETTDGQSCDTVVYNLWDREETGVQGGGTSISPAPPQPVDSLCYETNVLSFQEDSALGSDLAIMVDTSVLPNDVAAGWLKLQMSDSCSFNVWGLDDDYCDDKLPAVGFAFKSRDFGDATRNYGVLMKHGYDDNNCLTDEGDCFPLRGAF